MKKANEDIRLAARSAKINLWEIADVLGMHDANFSRELRHELPQEEKDKIFSIIDELAQEHDKEAG